MSDPFRTTLEEAAALLRGGKLCAFPTETVYGLGADATNPDAVLAIYETKGRPRFNPLIVHCADLAMAERFAQFSTLARELAEKFWPGPLSLVLPLRDGNGLADIATAGLDTVALRVPDHPLALDLLRATDLPLAAPSANPSGKISATTAAHVLAGLDGKIAAVLDDGACSVGLESTIIGLTGPRPTLLRAGGLPSEAIEAALGQTLEIVDGAEIIAPGQLASHYAPGAAVRLDAETAGPGEVLLGFGTMICDLNLSPAGDLTEAAAKLFDHLHQLDATGQSIAVAPIPDRGLGRAINDRLARAAAPR